jgi:hypothetical protein
LDITGEEHPIDVGDRRATRCSPEDREFVPQDDDFEFLEFLRPNAAARRIRRSQHSHT